MIIRMLSIISGLAIIGFVLWGPIVSNVEQTKYKVVESHDTIEIRDYDAMIVAETEVAGSRDEAISQGFRQIADYIFGNNVSQQKVAMTAPVMQGQSEKVAMTAPVTQQSDDGLWKVRFVMPEAYKIETLPKPKNAAVKLKEIPEKRFAVIRFSGLAGEKSLKERTTELQSFIKSKNLHPVSSPTYAFFNPPWTLPFLRRNEVMIEIKG